MYGTPPSRNLAIMKKKKKASNFECQTTIWYVKSVKHFFIFKIFHYNTEKVKVLVVQACQTLFNAMHCSPLDSSVHGLFQAGVSSHYLHQGIFPNQGLNLGPLHCRQIFSPSKSKSKTGHQLIKQANKKYENFNWMSVFSLDNIPLKARIFFIYFICITYNYAW